MPQYFHALPGPSWMAECSLKPHAPESRLWITDVEGCEPKRRQGCAVRFRYQRTRRHQRHFTKGDGVCGYHSYLPVELGLCKRDGLLLDLCPSDRGSTRGLLEQQGKPEK